MARMQLNTSLDEELVKAIKLLAQMKNTTVQEIITISLHNTFGKELETIIDLMHCVKERINKEQTDK